MSGVSLRSGSRALVDLFEWAVDTARSHVVADGATGPLDVDERHPDGHGSARYAASYRAGYGHRSGYYLRDFCHQAIGAQLLGLQRENSGMLASFVASVRDGWPAWALNFDGTTPLAIDVAADGRRVRELPAVFELVETMQSLHRWTGAAPTADDRAFAVHAVTGFVAAHDAERPNGIAEAGGPTIFDGVASYDESPDPPFFEAGDGIGAQYAATRHAAALAADSAGAVGMPGGLAERIRRLYRESWSRDPADRDDAVVSGWTREGSPATGWHREATWFPPLKGLMAGDPRLPAELDRIDALCRASATAPRNVEALTYLPDLFWRYGDADRAFAWMQRIFARREHPHPVAGQGADGTYPEVSFTLVAQCVAGILGIEPDAPRRRVALAPRLPRGVPFVDARDIPFGDGGIDVACDRDEVRFRNGTSVPLELRVVRRRRGQFRDPHLPDEGIAADAVVAPGESVAVSRVRARSSSGSAVPARRAPRRCAPAGSAPST
ncbi:hypothetical protein LK09_19105 [Microbacterium mangrovi]|uniref:Glycogen debranching enzyme C-terminal domain-containing protein n=1 Tax=Microbacterium mangrovi TaxID=1348253 RepID=A0A0B2A1L6_9MICO|nr:hypothetical protein [Microbacterium mangrovi]KHK95490.1 hypothetical protein LK09_19105 [Microbacterium mangrovi]